MDEVGSARRFERLVVRERGLSTIVSVLLIAVVLAVVGVASYGILGGFSPAAGKTCAPITSPLCAGTVNNHDVALLVPFRSLQQGTPLPLTASLPAGETSSKYVFNFGDGSAPVIQPNATIRHVYSTAGTYLIAVTATVNGHVHDNAQSLALISVTPTANTTIVGAQPTVAGSITGNSTAPANAKQVTAVLNVGQQVSVAGTYTAAPTNPLFNLSQGQLKVSSGGTAVSSNATISGAVGTFSFASPGNFTITFVGAATGQNTTVYSNYTWSVYVAPLGFHAGIAGLVVHRSPHPGSLILYEEAPGGGLSEDPAIDYETVGAEPIMNVYQPLITYNGSVVGPAPNDFIPVLATCVPGSVQCAKLYQGNTLIDGWNYTFVLNSNSSFYDPQTGGSWGVYPTDVMFTIARTLGFSTLPCQACNNGWIIAQALLSQGNGLWDSIHGVYNNTPGNVLNSMSINDSKDCPPAAISGAHGCITFRADGAGHDWPYFLELIADPLGGSIVPCGWFSAPRQDAGIPFWSQGNVSGSGDHPCGAPGSSGYGLAPSAIPVEGWDQWEEVGSGSFGYYLGNVQWSMAGTGPYYLADMEIANSYLLKANPAYSQNPDCTWAACPPAPHTYASLVSVQYESTATPGEEAYATGTADGATIPSTDFSYQLQLISQGKLNAISAPTFTIGFYGYDLNFNIANALRFTTTPITIPSNWFSYLGMREFFTRAYPYATIQQTINTKSGVTLSFGYGGAIPQFMSNYYPRDIPWPSTDPCTNGNDPTCPTYWWDQMQMTNGPYYDPQIASCSGGNPCRLPIFGTTGNPANDQVMALWAAQISSLTNGAVLIDPVDINFVNLNINWLNSPAGENAMPLAGAGWAPDYPDPTDYIQPLYVPNATYTQGDAIIQSLYTPSFTTGCAHGPTDYNYYANTSFPQSCQGMAYKAMLYAFSIAARTPDGPYRVLLYDLGEHIAYQLALYTYTGQGNEIPQGAPWLDTSSFNVNPTIGGGGDTLFYQLTGNDVQYPGST